MGGDLFIVSVTRGIVVPFFVSIGAVLLLRNASFRTFVCFRRNSVLFCGLIISDVDCRQSGCSYNVESL